MIQAIQTCLRMGILMTDQPFLVKPSSQMTLTEIEIFLSQSKIPLRISSVGSDGFPLVSSLWFIYQHDCFFCAIHRSSLVAKRFLLNEKCGFEVAADSMPYSGVRGQGVVSMALGNAELLLNQLFKRYAVEPDAYLAKWLLSRSEDEYVLQISPKWLTAWDFSSRMKK